MRKKLYFRYWLSFIILIVLLLVFIFWNINSGSISISLNDIFQILFHKNGDETAYNIVWEIRLPRILAAVILGGALSVSGFLLQTFFGNPIAGPFVLGISSGAKLIVALTMIYLLGKSMVATSGLMILAAFTGSLISMGFVLLISRKVKQMSMLVVSGIMIGYICSAITDFVVTFADDSNIVNLHNWSLGSFSGTSWDNVSVMAVVVFVALFIRLLRVGGRCACIVPDGVLFGSSKAHKNLRKELIENQYLEAVISMPSGVFKPYAGVSTAILIFTKTNGTGTDKVWFYDMKADGYSLDDKRQPVQENDIPDIIERFHKKENEEDRERTEQSFMVDKQEIIDNGYDLSINKYKKIEYVPVEYPPTEEILAEIEELNEEITKETAELRALLRK